MKFLKKLALITAITKDKNKKLLTFEMTGFDQDEDDIIDTIELRDDLVKNFQKNNLDVVNTGRRLDAVTIDLAVDKDMVDEAKKKMSDIATKNLIGNFTVTVRN